MPKLRILFTKAKETGGQDILTCIRADESRTWTKLHAAFPIHDMTHYAVETELHAKNGFFGLLAQGWDIADFGVPENRARMPLEALWAEHVVGVIWREFVTREATPYSEFCETIAATMLSLREKLGRNSKRQGSRAEYSDSDQKILSRVVSEEERANIMTTIGELAASWAHTARGEIMELSVEVN